MARVQDLTESVAVLLRNYWWKWTPGDTEWEYTGIKCSGFYDYMILDDECAVLFGTDAMYTGTRPSFPDQTGAVHFDPDESSPFSIWMGMGAPNNFVATGTVVKYDDVWWAIAGFFGPSLDGKDSNGDKYSRLGWYDDITEKWYAADDDPGVNFPIGNIQLKLAYGNMYALSAGNGKTDKFWKYNGTAWSDVWGDSLYPTDPGGDISFNQMQSHVTGDGNLYFCKCSVVDGNHSIVYWNGVEATGQFTTIADDQGLPSFGSGNRSLISYDGKMLALNQFHFIKDAGANVIRTGGGCIFAWDGTNWVQPSFGPCGTTSYYARNLAIKEDPNCVPSPNG